MSVSGTLAFVSVEIIGCTWSNKCPPFPFQAQSEYSMIELCMLQARGLISEDGLNFLDAARNKPYAAAQRISELLCTAVGSKVLLADMAPALDLNLSDLINSIGTCEMCVPWSNVSRSRTLLLKQNLCHTGNT